jgi:hypothetical protein
MSLAEQELCGELYAGICLEKASSYGRLSGCEHTFHFCCITRWSKISNLCPTCRVSFRHISHFKGAHFIKKVTVKRPRSQDDSEAEGQWASSEDEWGVVCKICGEAEQSDDLLVLCDGEEGECPNAYHMLCLGLDQSPAGRWLCSECQVLEDAQEEVSSEYSVPESQEEDSDSSDHSAVVSSDNSLANSESEDEQVSDSESEDEQVSDPDAEYVPEEEPEAEDTVPVEVPRRRLKLKLKHNRKRLRRIVPMNRTQRRDFIQKHVKANYQSETEAFDEAWIIFKAMQSQPDEGVLTRSQLSGDFHAEVARTKRSRSEECEVTPEIQFKVTVENLVADETIKILTTLIEKGTRPTQKQVALISSRVVAKLLQRDKGRQRTDRRSLEKMKASIRSIWSCELSVEI